MEKFMIYYEPITDEEKGTIKSFTYVAEPVGNEYKLKIVEEIYNGETVDKIKVKKMCKDISSVIKSINSINFNIDVDNNKNDGLIIIKYGDKKLVASNLDSVSTILNLFKIKEYLTLTKEELQKVNLI